MDANQTNPGLRLFSFISPENNGAADAERQIVYCVQASWRPQMILNRRSLMIGMTLTLLPALAFGSAPVYGLKSPYRVAGQYLVVFKTSQELAATAPAQLATALCPSLRPTDRQQAQKLARCLADNVGATLIGTMSRPIGGREVAVVKDLSDSGLSILENDPRVNSIQADQVAKEAAVQNPIQPLATR